jgi:hypothetical protein
MFGGLKYINMGSIPSRLEIIAENWRNTKKISGCV